jgi:ubiquinone/menaquinone biosynthesis C-methylase UbiE
MYASASTFPRTFRRISNIVHAAAPASRHTAGSLHHSSHLSRRTRIGYIEATRMSTPNPAAKPTPERIMEAFNAYQRTAAMKTAIELDLFSLIGRGKNSIASLAAAARASERGLRILCDNLVTQGFLTKHDSTYALTPDSQAFLDRNSPTCIIDAAQGFFASDHVMRPFQSLTEAIRRGRNAADDDGMMDPEDPAWVDFAVSMATVQAPMAHNLAKILSVEDGRRMKVLDVAAGHGLFGIAIAAKNPNAEIYSQDWAPVLEVAQKQADIAGVASRFHKIPGSAFDIDLGSGYDLALLTNFLQLLDPATIETFLKKLHAALAPNGRVATLGFIPNDDRISPPAPALMSLMFFASTPGGEAYTLADYTRMFRSAGFKHVELVPVPNAPQQLVIATK